MIVDSHCHLDRLKFGEQTLDDVVREAHEADISHMLCVGIDMDNAETVKSIADKYPSVFCSVGVHPLDIDESLIQSHELDAIAQHEKVVAIGETGLDYYYSEDNKRLQQESLVLHLEVAKRQQLPVIIHTRDARKDTIDLLKEHACTQKVGVLHCFTESWDMAKQALDLGFYISFSGIVTFKNAKELQEVAKQVPIDRMLVETDSPYLTPVPFRGKPNFPKYTRQVAEFIAQLRGENLETIASQTTDNFFSLFDRAKKMP